MNNATADDFKQFCIPYAPSPLDAYRGRGPIGRVNLTESLCKCTDPKCQEKYKAAEEREKELDKIVQAYITWSKGKK
jgi:hypothetical protein